MGGSWGRRKGEAMSYFVSLFSGFRRRGRKASQRARQVSALSLSSPSFLTRNRASAEKKKTELTPGRAHGLEQRPRRVRRRRRLVGAVAASDDLRRRGGVDCGPPGGGGDGLGAGAAGASILRRGGRGRGGRRCGDDSSGLIDPAPCASARRRRQSRARRAVDATHAACGGGGGGGLFEADGDGVDTEKAEKAAVAAQEREKSETK